MDTHKNNTKEFFYSKYLHRILMRKLNSDSIIVFVKKSDLKRVPYANQASQFQGICRVYQCLAEHIFICLHSSANIHIWINIYMIQKFECILFQFRRVHREMEMHKRHTSRHILYVAWQINDGQIYTQLPS